MNKLLSILISFFCLCCALGYAHEPDVVESKLIEKRYTLYFRVNKSNIEPSYMGNDHTIKTMVNDINATLEMSGAIPGKIVVYASTSPEGPQAVNDRLAIERAKTSREFILKMFPQFDPEQINVESRVDDWSGLLQVLRIHPQFPQRDEMMRIICSDADNRTKDLRLRELKYGWERLVTDYIHTRRNSVITLTVVMTADNADDEFVVDKRESSIESEPVDTIARRDTIESPESIAAPMTVADTLAILSEPYSWSPNIYLKVNTLGAGMGITNLAGEIDLAKHWSIAVPVYYSAWNYFTPTIKFRTLAVQPEARYWFKNDNNGFYVAAHLGYAQYNIAVDGELRYQDHNGTSPAIGGGIGLGYKMPISDNNRWHIEFALGAGAYKLHYDTFHNVNNGKLIATYQDVYLGIDNAAINISYSFNLKKRKK